jgi:PIN domain nuclease of toxin-antitoxin system
MVSKMRYVTDTHTLIWYLTDTLPMKIDKIFESAEKGESTIFVPIIVLIECLYTIYKGRIDLEFDSLLNRIKMEKKFIPVILDMEILELLPEIELKDAHDRIIVATAKKCNAKLITKDRKIKKAGIVQITWKSES